MADNLIWTKVLLEFTQKHIESSRQVSEWSKCSSYKNNERKGKYNQINPNKEIGL